MKKLTFRLGLAAASVVAAWAVHIVILPPPALRCGGLDAQDCHACCVDAKNDFKANLCGPLSGQEQAACEHRVNTWFQNCLDICNS